MTPEEAAKRKKEWVAKMKQEGKMKENMSEDHKTVLNALQNPARRKILKALERRRMSLEEIKAEFKLTDYQARYNLNMLESTLCIEKEDSEESTYYVLTPRGEGYVENVELKK
ncbi:helix-turn-helix domain-containing protein [Methanosarcina sp. DH2]|uniref:winged helix-turn-helix domain-containing protein n=1 Tax=Methanosarcina sp. DH2 TaxID=2605639 RepID=UPI001E30FCEF|nr:winged helix-turn-helix domain-containing protein [Methanosarcina sp. DH2]MCC4770105.1 helix-turn-helix domain-containing protein [Methanosarcina sp. DH2]